MTETFREKTICSQYQQKQRLPVNFSTVLKEYTREVLREQPEDVLTWSANYFKKLAFANDPALAVASINMNKEAFEKDADQISPEQEVISLKMAKIFAEMDQNSNSSGRLFAYLIKRGYVDSMGLTPAQALYILTSDYAIIDEQATMDYIQLARDSVATTLFFQQTNYTFSDIEHLDDDVTIHGMLRNELETKLHQALCAADTDGMDKIQFTEYINVLSNTPIDLTRRDIMILLVEADVQNDGSINIKNEVGKAFPLLLLSASFTEFDKKNQ